MPLGNSITMGRHGEPAGYRDDLSTLLVNDGINFTMVGSVNDGTGFYPNHEGHSGWEAGELDVFVNYWLDLNPADFVLLHIGTNDISHQIPIQTAIQDIENIIDKIRNKNSQTKILLCSIIPRWEDWIDRPERTDQLNVLIYDLYSQKLGQGYDIYFVDQANAFYSNPNWTQEYMDDNAHPNDTGYHVMALTFYNILNSILDPAPQFYSITGSVLYYANSDPINNVQMNLTGGATTTELTNSSGDYAYINLEDNLNYLVQPTKEKIDRSENTAVTMYDAALTLRHAVGMETLSGNAQMAADVDKDGQVIAYDAAMIARYVVELDALANDHVGEWLFSPGSRYFQSLSSNRNGQNYTGILLGDVSGGWNQNIRNELLKANNEWLSEINVELENIINLPITIFEDSLYSLFAEIEFPPELLQFESIDVNFNSAYENNVLHVVNDNKLKLGIYFSSPHLVAGTFLSVNFKTHSETPGTGLISLKKLQINDHHPKQALTRVAISVNNRNNVPFTVAENYPNPFNPTTIIPYNIEKAGRIKIVIYDMLGRDIKTLLNEEQIPGTYKISWDGKNRDGFDVANGMYVYNVIFERHSISRTMIKLN